MERIDAYLNGQAGASSFQIDGQLSTDVYYFAAIGDPATGESRILLGTETGLHEIHGTLTVHIGSLTTTAWTSDEISDFQDARRFTDTHWRALAALVKSVSRDQFRGLVRQERDFINQQIALSIREHR